VLADGLQLPCMSQTALLSVNIKIMIIIILKMMIKINKNVIENLFKSQHFFVKSYILYFTFLDKLLKIYLKIQ
jgi:hypothetical protein